MAESGYLVLVDITGYTSFMTGSELSHAQEIIESLIDTIIDHLHAPLTLYKLEGDAVVAFSLDEDAMQGQSLVESVEHLYYAFHQELEGSDRNTTCSCKACSNMNSLDLKAVIHHGEFGLQKVRATNQFELIGNDVIIAHRLLKNSIPETTGIGAYAFFSEAAAKVMNLSDFTANLTQHGETYEHIGEINGFVHNLKPAWDKEKERRRVFVSHKEAWVVLEDQFEVPQSIAWDYFTSPESMEIYLKSDKVTAKDTNNGRIDSGSTYHCAHGKTVSKFFIIDWKPFSYLTVDIEFLPSITGRYTVHFVPETKTKTLVKYNILSPTSNKTLQKIFIKLFLNTIFKTMTHSGYKSNFTKIQELIKADKKSGQMKMRMVTAEPQPLD